MAGGYPPVGRGQVRLRAYNGDRLTPVSHRSSQEIRIRDGAGGENAQEDEHEKDSAMLHDETRRLLESRPEVVGGLDSIREGGLIGYCLLGLRRRIVLAHPGGYHLFGYRIKPSPDLSTSPSVEMDLS